jgi:hypothetical protein
VVELVDPVWKRKINTENLTIYGVLGESDEVTLLDAIARTTTLDDKVRRVSGYTLVLGAMSTTGPNGKRQSSAR